MLDRVTAGEAVREIIDLMRARTGVGETLRSLLERVRGMTDAGEAYILVLEGERLRLRAAVGLPLDADASIHLGEGIEGLAAGLKEIVTVPDAARYPRYRDLFRRSAAVGAMVAVPVVLRGRVTGVLAVTRPRPGQFGGSNLWWLDVFGALAGLAIEDDRIYRAQERRARQAEALTAIGAEAGAGLDGVFYRLAAALKRALDVSLVDLLLAEPTGTYLVSCGWAGATGVGVPKAPARVAIAAGGPLARVYFRREPLVCNDIRDDRTLRDLFGTRPESEACSLLAVPVVAGGESRGVLYLAHDAGFSDDDPAFVSIVGARIGALIEADDLRLRQAQLQRAEAEAQARQEFVGIVSHELKTPVAVIQAYTDLLLRRAERTGGDANVDVVRRIAEQAERMLGLIDEMLDLQRLEGGLFALEHSQFDLIAVARRTVEATQATTTHVQLALVAGTPSTEGDNGRIDPARQDGPIVVSADRRRVEEVLQNLLDNAVKFSPEGGRIEVSVRLAPAPGGNKAIVAVVDQGPGIEPGEQPRVFERFYQGGDRLQRGHVGLGLGLYISREIVRRHGGEMWLESAPGKGSTFSFSLPAAGPEED
ncbi:MAG: sensor histidine kinase [Chloroflexota bacterium]